MVCHPIARTLASVLTTAELAKMTISLLVMIDAIGTAPMFLALTARHSDHRTRIALLASLTCFVALICSAFLGDVILKLFGISIDSFRVIGGVLLFLMALDMLNAKPSRTKQTPEEGSEAISRRELAIVPLGIPLMAGPGAISSVLIYMNKAELPADKALIVGMIAFVVLVSFGIFAGATWIAPKLGRTGMNVLNRLMGLVLGAIAVEMLVGGLRAMIPALGQAAGAGH